LKTRQYGQIFISNLSATEASEYYQLVLNVLVN